MKKRNRSRLRLFAASLLMWANIVCLSAQSVNPVLATLFQKTLDAQRLSLNAKGLSAAVCLPDGSIWAGASGISSELPNVATDTAQVFGIASITKTLTAACILQMADEGLLNLDDPLHFWLDTFQYVNPNITIRQLLRHQSGLFDVLAAPNFQNILFADQDSIWALRDVIQTFIAAPNFQPGAGWGYSNTNYILLGMIAEKVAGKTYFESFRQRFLVPLGLTSFAMRPFEAVQNDVAHVWLDLNADGTPDDAHNLLYNWHSFDAATGPAGSYYATARDLARWIRAFGSGSLHSAGMFAQAKTTVTTSFPNGTRYGLGLMERSFWGYKAYGHGGDSGYSGSAWHFPVKNVSIAVLNNDGRRTSWQVGAAVQALFKTFLDNETVLAAPKLAETSPVRVFPNPFSSDIQVSCENWPAAENELNWTLRNTLGETVATGQTPVHSGTSRLGDFGKLPAGFYFLELFDGEKRVAAERVVKT